MWGMCVLKPRNILKLITPYFHICFGSLLFFISSLSTAFSLYNYFYYHSSHIEKLIGLSVFAVVVSISLLILGIGQIRKKKWVYKFNFIFGLFLLVLTTASFTSNLTFFRGEGVEYFPYYYGYILFILFTGNQYK